MRRSLSIVFCVRMFRLVIGVFALSYHLINRLMSPIVGNKTKK